LVSLAREQNLVNVKFLPQQPRERIPALIRASDICLVLLKKAPVFRTVIPTKMLEFMACGRPVILGVDGQARQVLEEAKGGIFIEPENHKALLEEVIHLYKDSAFRKTLGQNGRNYIVGHLSREQTAKIYTTVLENVVLNWKNSTN
jgi:glycosyltransferase involved in cell wall biosynthesis